MIIKIMNERKGSKHNSDKQTEINVSKEDAEKE